MKFLPLGLSSVLLLAPLAPAQFTSAEQLIDEAQSSPIPGIPLDGIWTRQFFIGEGDAYIQPVDGGWLDVVTHDRIFWSDARKSYRGMLEGRVLPIGDDRILIERDLPSTGQTRVTILEWHGTEMHAYKFDTADDSTFARHMGSQRVQLSDGVISGNRDAILSALRTLPLGERELDERLRRPSHAEMGFIWNYFELQRWHEQHLAYVNKFERNYSRLQSLGQLHLAQSMASEAAYADIARLDALSLSAYEFGRLTEDSVRSLYRRASSLVKRFDVSLEERMTALAKEIEILEHVEKQLDPDNPFDFVLRPFPGMVLEVQLVVTAEDGTVLQDTRKDGEPTVIPLMGDVPSGIQFGLRTVGYDESIKLRVPADLAFGPQYGTVDIELEIVRVVPDRRERPPIEGILRAEIATLPAEESDSGLRYRDLVVGEGVTPKRGQEVQVRTMSWNAMGVPQDEPRVQVAKLGSAALLAGVNEALASMHVGGQRVLFVPRHLAHQDPARAGSALCVVVELVSITP